MQPQANKVRRQVMAVTALTFVITLGWVVAILLRTGGDPKGFILIGTRYSNHDPAGSTGYDGQFGYYIATEGFAAQPKLDTPTYRYQRILYPLIAGLLGLGQTSLVPWTLIALNIVAMTVATWLLAGWLVRYRKSPWYALVFATWIGCLFVVRLDLNELLCMALGFAGLLLILDERISIGVASLALSALTKDMGFVFIAAAGLYIWSLNRRRAVIIVALAALPYLLWAVILQLALVGPRLSTYSGPALSIMPFSGYAQAKTQIELLLMTLWLIIPALVIGGWAVFRLTKGDASLPVCFALAAALWVVYLPGATAFDLVASYRVAAPIVPAGLLFAAQIRRRSLLWGLTALWLPALIQILLLPGFFT